MNTLAFATIQQLQAALRSKQISSGELLTHFYERFDQYDGEIKAALEVFARDSLRCSNPDGFLAGIPGLIKDNIAMKGRKLSCASRMLEHFVSPYSATVSERLVAEGAVLLGRANLDEFAMGSSTESSAYQLTKNPWNYRCVPGGSSGGSAAAVAAGLVPWALGSDTGGSVRQPAAFCGIVGMKPTYGRVSRYGLVAYGSSLDHIGVFSRTVRDNAQVLSAIAGQDSKDATSLAVSPQRYDLDLSEKLPRRIKIGVVDNLLHALGMNDEIVQSITTAIGVLSGLGAEIVHSRLPLLDYSAATYFILSRAEAASNLARFDGVRYGDRAEDVSNLREMYQKTRHDKFGSEVKARIMIGNYVLSVGHAGEYYDNAQRARCAIRQQFADAFADVDLLLMPTHPAPAFEFGSYYEDKLQIDLQDYFTCPMNLSGVPAISIPCGFTQSTMPIGMQLVGPHCSEQLIYQVAHVYEQATEWHTHHPRLQG